MESIMQDKKVCFFCGTTQNLEEHHCIHGTANRKQSEKYGLKVWLCADDHRLKAFAVHRNNITDMYLKQEAQRVFEEKSGTREDFRRIFGKSFL